MYRYYVVILIKSH